MGKNKIERISKSLADLLNQGKKEFNISKIKYSEKVADEMKLIFYKQKKKRKGNIAINIIFIVLFLLMFSIGAIFWGYIQNEITAELVADDDIQQESKDQLTEFNNTYPSLFDGIFVFIFFMFWVMTIISSLFIDSHPVFFIISFILLISSFVVIGYLSNTFEEIMTDEEISNYSDNFPMTKWIFSHLVLIVLVVALTEAIVLYGKFRGFSG